MENMRAEGIMLCLNAEEALERLQAFMNRHDINCMTEAASAEGVRRIRERFEMGDPRFSDEGRRGREEQCGMCRLAIVDPGDPSVGMDAFLDGCGHPLSEELADPEDGLCVRVPCPGFHPYGEETNCPVFDDILDGLVGRLSSLPEEELEPLLVDIDDDDYECDGVPVPAGRLDLYGSAYVVLNGYLDDPAETMRWLDIAERLAPGSTARAREWFTDDVATLGDMTEDE